MTTQSGFDAVVENLASRDPLKAATIYGLSEPSEDALEALTQLWPSVDVDRRRQVMSRIAESSETEFQLDFSTIALLGIRDEDSEVRIHSIEALWVNDSIEVMNALVGLVGNDPSIDVEAAAADALGKYVLFGETQEIPLEAGRAAQNALLRALARHAKKSAVHLRALSSIAYSGSEEAARLIQAAAESDSVEVRATAILGMGRHGASRWSPSILRCLQDDEPQIRFEAARACGEIGIQQAVPSLTRLCSDPDRELREVAIWALGEIGSLDARQALMALADTETDDEMLELIEDSINMASLLGGELSMRILARGNDDMDGEVEDYDEFDALN